MSAPSATLDMRPGSVDMRAGWGSLVVIALPLIFTGLCFANWGGLIALSGGARALLLFGLLIAMMGTGMPISIALGLSVLIFIFTMTTVVLDTVALKLFTGMEKWEIMAIPFFILAGNFLTHGGIAKRMIDFATSLIGHWYGGLALAGIIACAMFALVCGSSVATVVAIGSILLPEMVKAGYPMRFGAAVITVAGSLGILMLPSIPKVIYAISTNTSIGALFIAGVLPGTLLTIMLCATTWYLAKKQNFPRLPKATWGQAGKAFLDSFWGLMLVFIIIGGIYSGAFTATEAAAMSAVYAFFIAVFVYRATKLRDVPKVLIRSANMSAMLLYIITNAVLFSFVLTNENIPNQLSEWMISLNLGPFGFLLLVNLLLLVAGNFMEPSSIILIMSPILFPTAMKLGIDPVHFGIMIDVNMEVGLCHPPVGLNLYVASGISKIGITELTKAVLPWLCTMLVFLVIVTYWPWLTLVLPHALGMKTTL
jgi:C4-dicarboxylate transporter, DctM subunit